MTGKKTQVFQDGFIILDRKIMGALAISMLIAVVSMLIDGIT